MKNFVPLLGLAAQVMSFSWSESIKRTGSVVSKNHSIISDLHLKKYYFANIPAMVLRHDTYDSVQ